MSASMSIAKVRRLHLAFAAILIAGALIAATLPQMSTRAASETKGPFQFEPLLASVACTAGGNSSQPFQLPEGYVQNVVASEPQFPDLPDMHTLNENGPQAGRFLFRTHEVGSNGAVSVTDLVTGETHILA